MAAAPIYKNVDSSTNIEQPESGRLERTYQTDNFTYTREGKYAKMLTEAPAIGAAKDGGYVSACSVDPLHGGMAKLVYTVQKYNTSPILEVSWTQSQVPLERHPRYQVGGAQALSKDDLAAIQQWKTSMLYSDDATVYPYMDSAGKQQTLASAAAKDFAVKYLRGNESYLVFCPIAKRTTCNYITLTVGSNLGSFSSSVPFTGCPAGYKWLKVGDTATFQGGLWTRVEEWQGFETLDSDLYS